MIEIKWDIDEDGVTLCAEDCVLWSPILEECRAGFEEDLGEPGDECPGPGVYVLINKEG